MCGHRRTAAAFRLTGPKEGSHVNRHPFCGSEVSMDEGWHISDDTGLHLEIEGTGI
jgi:hypothetical protein